MAGQRNNFTDRIDSLRELIAEHARPIESAVEARGMMSATEWSSLVEGGARLGLLAYNLPVSVGGTGLTLRQQVAVAVELGRTSQAIAEFLCYVPESVLLFNADQRRAYLPGLVSGEKTITLALTEPEGGTQLNNLRTSATKSSTGWLLNGRKKFVTRGDNSDIVIVLARTGSSGKATEDLSAFAVEHGVRGFGSELIATMGWRGESMAQLTFNDCELPQRALIGRVGDGLKVLMRGVTGTRLRVAAKCVGVMRDLKQMAVERINSRSSGRSSLGGVENVRMKLADIDIAERAATLLCDDAARVGDTCDGGYLNRGYRAAVSGAKVFATEAAWRSADSVLQVFGALGYTKECRVERIYRDVRGYRIGEGTSEILRLDVARHALGDL